MGDVVTMDDIKRGRKYDIEWASLGYKKEGETYPLKVWENLECVLEKHNIKIRLNAINHEVDFIGLKGATSRNGKILDIHSLQTKEGLCLNKDDNFAAIKRIAEKNQYNPFVDMLRENENTNSDLVLQLFKCLELSEEEQKNKIHYLNIFIKWCINVVRTSHNSLENDFGSQGVLVLQGGQGTFKSTFSRKLMPNKEWFKGDKSLDPEKTDSVMQNTTYTLVEWGELDSTLKGEQSKLKQFITATNDEYRSPYDRVQEKYPRLTSYIGTVNKKDFLKDETGSRRFWIIPVVKCNIEEMDKINMCEFWGCIYNIYKKGEVKCYLSPKEQEVLAQINKQYSFESDISILIADKFEWDSCPSEWGRYKTSAIAEYLGVRDIKKVKLELERRGLEYKTYKIKGTNKSIKGFEMPRFEMREFGY